PFQEARQQRRAEPAAQAAPPSSGAGDGHEGHDSAFGLTNACDDLARSLLCVAEVRHETLAARIERALQCEVGLRVQHRDIARLVHCEVARSALERDESPPAHEAGHAQNALGHVLAVVPLVEIALEVFRDVGPDEEETAHGFPWARMDAT